MPTSRDMAIFVLTTTTKPITLPLAHARGVINVICDRGSQKETKEITSL